MLGGKVSHFTIFDLSNTRQVGRCEFQILCRLLVRSLAAGSDVVGFGRAHLFQLNRNAAVEVRQISVGETAKEHRFGLHSFLLGGVQLRLLQPIEDNVGTGNGFIVLFPVVSGLIGTGRKRGGVTTKALI